MMVVVAVVAVAVLLEMVTTISDNLTACRGVPWARPAVCVRQDTPGPFFTHTLPCLIPLAGRFLPGLVQMGTLETPESLLHRSSRPPFSP